MGLVLAKERRRWPLARARSSPAMVAVNRELAKVVLEVRRGVEVSWMGGARARPAALKEGEAERTTGAL